MTGAVLDASALIAFLLDEPGGDVVPADLSDCLMTTVNLGEVVGHFARKGSSEGAIRRMLEPLPIQRVPFDEDMAFATGLLIAVTRSAGLSLGDRACLALARRSGLPVLTADRLWKTIADAVGVEVRLIR